MKITFRSGGMSDVGTGFDISDSDTLDVSGTHFKRVDTIVNRQSTGQSSKITDFSAQITDSSLNKSSVGWNRNYECNYPSIFLKEIPMNAIQIEDNDMSDVGVVYKGSDDAEVSIKRNKMNGVGIVALTVPTGTLLTDGKRVIELPLPKNFTQGDLNQLIKIIKGAKANGEDVNFAVESSPHWANWLSYGADAAAVLEPVIEILNSIIG